MGRPTTPSRGLDSPAQAGFRRQVRPPYFESIWLEYGKELPIAVFTLASIVCYLLLHFVWRNLQWESVPLYVALGVGGVPLLMSLTREAFKLHFGSDWLAGISIVTAVLLKEYLVGSIVVLMLSGGSALEQYATHRASSALRALARRMPTVAHRVTDTALAAVPIDSIAPGDLLEIFPHEICPADGEVVEGYGRMDESYLTGEPFEISKAPGSQVLSGAINRDTVLRVRASRPAEDSRYARILRVVSQAEQNRPPLRRLADRLGGWYTPWPYSSACWAGSLVGARRGSSR